MALNLGELIAALEAADQTYVVPIGFVNPHSYRGDYYDLAFEPAENVSVASMLALARGALGATYEGWKGGDYTMDEYVDCYLSYEGDSGESIGPVLLSYMLGRPAMPERWQRTQRSE